ncbi:hypothetical protein [Piscinibacter gummiphilus]|uniref:Uncharacterized protein n=1 Tax=Piscinibacter gummiphilus TaxID=946333 RepID=A0A1W6LBX0_9BURK|nr:hypothetical protein [Piscinibacter gummiphilus]ARN21781.1 hypothetical protein A4W93_18820 [Piscinibacter gummiphilus]ATU66467.1 hypothetical protein CPZ87_18905 [Piscinibacter gummiphilus]GLS95353.1 hypothetical protein GCM10007918_26450 [Piscinibacter gummiphilus]
MADSNTKSTVELVVSLVQVLSVVVGVYLSVQSFNHTRDKETEARHAEAEARRLEAERPFRELRRTVYLEAVKTAAVIATPEGRTAEELGKARRRFRELYIAELSMVEGRDVEARMVALASAVDADLGNLNQSQAAALQLARALGQGYRGEIPSDGAGTSSR